MSNDKLEKVKKSVDGLVFGKEIDFIYESAKSCNNGAIVEIGSWCGLSTICLALGSKDGHNLPVYAIDPQNQQMFTPDVGQTVEGDEGHPEEDPYNNVDVGIPSVLDAFKERLKIFEVDDIVTPIVNYSELAYHTGLGREWDKPIGLLYIDGDHRYKYVKMDLELWGKHMVSGSRLIMHDYVYPGVFKAIHELVIGNPKYSAIYNNFAGGDVIFNALVK